ncbi:MAG: hypothetical protein U9O78_01170, partial [Patescibacteria group bacterium]|nr:hypothetical protein [Patescibacteria group bacterium]
MLNINYICNNIDQVKQACQDKQFDPSIVDDLLSVNQTRCDLKAQVDNIRHRINQNADQIKQEIHDGGKPSPKLIAKGKKIKQELKKIEPKFKQAKQEFNKLMLHIPNVPADEVPVGEDEADNVVVRQEG